MARRPNLVLFLPDQMRADALSCYGNTVCRTPNLDRLAAGGVRFRNAFTTSPVCSPARASLLTGLYPHNHGVMVNTHIAPAFSRGLDPRTPTFSRALSDAGYALDYVGKWHVHADLKPEDFGFDRHVTPEASWKAVEGSEIFIDFPGGRQRAAGVNAAPREECESWRYAEQGIAFIRERAAAGGPFFLRIDVNAPHFANVPPEPYASMYDPASIPPWPNFGETYEGKPASHLRKHLEWHLAGKGWDWWSRVVAKYYGDVSYIDECVGRVMAALDECGIADETVLVFATDHGDATGSHRHFEKAGTMYDEVYRIPLIVRGPGVAGGVAARGFARGLDLAPTFAEMGGTALPESIDGASLVPLLAGEEPPEWPDSVYAEHHGEVWGYHSQRMVRTSGWKYVYNPHDLDELYDLQADGAEMRNLIFSPEHAGVLAEMKSRLLGWNDATGDMFRWSWVRWNFPEPVGPGEVTPERLPLTCGG